jgi:hypothetical protein
MSREVDMKKDRYLKIILTIIAICLVWICVRGVKIGGENIFASDSSGQEGIYVSGGKLDVTIAGSDGYSLMYAGPLEVTVLNPDEIADAISEYLSENN